MSARALGLVALLFAASARADGWDFAAGGGARLLPAAAAGYARAGYGKLLWGARRPGDFRYGYVRPTLTLQTSAVVNRVDAAVAVHPISFVGLAAGHMGSLRLIDTRDVDCDAVACRGLLGTSYLAGHLALGAGRFFAGGDGRLAWMRAPDAARPFVDEVSVLVGDSGGDRMLSGEAFAGARLTPRWRAGALFAVESMLAAGGDSDAETLFAAARAGAWRFTVGAGAYRSTAYERGFTAYVVVSWIGIPSVELD
ncbi:MAG: hypothetical protein AABZ30_10055 [Myxococcota bacterium]